MRLSARSIFVLLAAAALGLLGAALAIGEAARVQPCYLCNFQRFLYIVLAFFALCGALLPLRHRIWSALVGLTGLGGVIAAGWQSWMQFAPDTATECGFGDPTLVERLVDWLGAQWPAMFMVTGFCTSKDWIFLGLSLANWSAIAFLGLLGVAVWQFLRRA